MKFALGFVNTSSQMVIRYFCNDDHQPSTNKTISLFDLDGEDLHGIFIPKKLMTSEVLSTLKEKESLYPLREADSFFEDEKQFLELNFENAHHNFQKIHDHWILQNNLKLIEEIFTISKYLKSIFSTNRTKFFSELWTILKSNLGTSELRIIYNDLLPAENNKKNKLIHSKIEGNILPEYLSAEEVDSILMEKFQEKCRSHFEIEHYDSEKNELTALATINQGPVIIMAKLFTLTAIQNSVIKALFDGIQLDF